ncbi:pyruvate, phosphate dikinase [Actinocrinis puniceicyclus]|uniref:Pyruvate, phosphate dikinase n=1 Tax=Actinocrinis puniceicyclus TaxID=977794 RepID=A0A8J8BAL5_9ACTN|nr:pyruvate, phosphate dikinase [Actinocrinis puniceicyclus]MBS2961525.1 pyruvate, phosphate dikinase [Actinocrinis puniceicyclus]
MRQIETHPSPHQIEPAHRYIYDFADGRASMADLLGGKGANLAEMTRLGLPVPPGFTVTTEACRYYLRSGRLPAGLNAQLAEHLATLEDATGRRLGGLDEPLLVSVRSGAKFSMPGMMDTILNIGVCDATVDGLAKLYGDERFAWDCYRRLVQMYGKTVLGVPAERFEQDLIRAKVRKGLAANAPDTDLDADALRALTRHYQQTVRECTGQDVPQNPREQLTGAVRAVFESWNGERAHVYRRREHISEDLGTAVTVMAMVFGNLGADSGTGVGFTRDPATGAPGAYGDYLTEAEGEDVVSGVRNTLTLEQFGAIDPASHAALRGHMTRLEEHYHDLCDVEFTVERGKLWMLQTRVGKRTAAAAFRIAADLLDEGRIDEDEALARVSGDQLAQLMFPCFAPTAAAAVTPVAFGVAASPGAAVGRAVFDSADAAERAAAGEHVILVRRETNPDDLPGMIAAVGVLTGRGGKTSHAAVVARGLGRTCVCGVESLEIDEHAGTATVARGQAAGAVIHRGDVISIDGTEGAVYASEIPVVPSPLVEYFEGRQTEKQGPSGQSVRGADPVIAAVARLLAIADRRARLGVRANADTPADAARARRFGAHGIGLARTEHMFLGERRPIVERLILAETPQERARALNQLLALQRADFTGLLAAMDGLPVTVRLLDPPLHEFLPDLTELSVEIAVADATHRPVEPERRRLLAAVRRWHEENPMLGLRGVRLGLVVPGLYAMQVRALAEAMAARRADGGAPVAHVMIPLVAEVRELELARAEAIRVLREVDPRLTASIGVMIELPRAALTAGAIAKHAEFFSFGTNDLTQTTWGMSRDDAEGAFFPAYLEQGVFAASPFGTVDAEGVGALVRIAVERGRATRPDLEIGVCGEHGGDPESIHFFHDAGVDYVSCSPFRVPVARLEAGRAAVLAERAAQGAAVGSDTR